MLNPRIFIKRFGLIEGLQLYWKFRYGKTNELQLSELKHPLYMQPNTIDNHSFYEIFLKEDYNFKLSLDKTQVKFIIDAGANIGFSTVFFANKFPSAKIIGIEPDNTNFKCFIKNTQNYTQIEAIKGAVWCKSKHMEIKDEGWGTRGFMVNEVDQESQNSIKGYSIRDLMKQYEMQWIDILKLDVEGSELEIFSSNYEEWLPKTKCLIIELHDRMRPGCSEAVKNAVGKYTFEMFERGENQVYINTDFRD
jgi:FkbM family methyltransferase